MKSLHRLLTDSVRETCRMCVGSLDDLKSVLPSDKANKLPQTSAQVSKKEICFSVMIFSGEVSFVHCVFVVRLQQQMENADAERDIYDELLTQAEIQGNVNKVNGESHERRCVNSSRFPRDNSG